MSERTEIQKQCLDLLLSLEQQGLPVYGTRTNSGRIRTDQGYYVQLCRPGFPDVICCIKGKFVGIETKKPKKDQNDNQKIAAAAIRNSGGEYLVIRKISELAKYIEKTLNVNLRSFFLNKHAPDSG